MACALQNGKGGYGERGGPRGVWEGSRDQAAARPWRAGRRRQCGLGDGSAARREARGRQHGSEGGPGTAARLGGRSGDGSAARRKEARRQLRGSEGGTEAAARLGGRPGGGSAVWRDTVRFGERECGEVEEAVQSLKESFVVFRMKRTVAKQKQLRIFQS